MKMESLLLKIVPYPQFHPGIVLFFAEVGASPADDQRRPETQFPIGEAAIEQLRRQGIAPVERGGIDLEADLPEDWDDHLSHLIIFADLIGDQ